MMQKINALSIKLLMWVYLRRGNTTLTTKVIVGFWLIMHSFPRQYRGIVMPEFAGKDTLPDLFFGASIVSLSAFLLAAWLCNQVQWKEISLPLLGNVNVATAAVTTVLGVLVEQYGLVVGLSGIPIAALIIVRRWNSFGLGILFLSLFSENRRSTKSEESPVHNRHAYTEVNSFKDNKTDIL
jgi:hypothetical protein